MDESSLSDDTDDKDEEEEEITGGIEVGLEEEAEDEMTAAKAKEEETEKAKKFESLKVKIGSDYNKHIIISFVGVFCLTSVTKQNPTFIA